MAFHPSSKRIRKICRPFVTSAMRKTSHCREALRRSPWCSRRPRKVHLQSCCFAHKPFFLKKKNSCCPRRHGCPINTTGEFAVILAIVRKLITRNRLIASFFLPKGSSVRPFDWFAEILINRAGIPRMNKHLSPGCRSNHMHMRFRWQHYGPM